MLIVNVLAQPVSSGPESHFSRRFSLNVLNKFGPDHVQIKAARK
jgi:hypothetical protein